MIHKILQYFSFALTAVLFFLPIVILTNVASAVDPGCYTQTSSSEDVSPTSCPSPDDESRVARGACLLKREDSTAFVSIDCGTLQDSASTDINNPDVTFSGDGSSSDEFAGGKESLSSGRSDACESTELSSENCVIVGYLVTGINFLSAIAGMAIIASIMFAGYQYMTAQDNSGQVEAAKKRIVWAMIALAIFIFMYSVLNWLVPGGVI